MSIIQQIRGYLLPAQSSGIPAGLQKSPTGNSEFGKFLPSESAVRISGELDGVAPSDFIKGEPRGTSSLVTNPLPPDIAPGDASGSGIHPLPPDIAPGNASGSGIHPLPPDIAPGNASGSGIHPLPPDIAPSGASSTVRLVIGSQPFDLTEEIEGKFSQIDLFHSLQSARAYALNSIVDVLDRGAVGTVV